MMDLKSYGIITLFVFFVFASASCERHLHDGDALQARFSCEVATKVAEDKWELGDSVGISGVSGSRKYSNICYRTGDGAIFAPVGEAIYYLNSEPVTFSAYYPWKNELGGDSDFRFSVRQQSDFRAFDWLWAEGVGQKTDKEPVSLVFSHRMSKLTLRVRGVNGVGFESVRSAKCGISAIADTCLFSREDGGVSAVSDMEGVFVFANNSVEQSCNTASVYENPEGNEMAYTILLAPQEFSSDNMLKFHVYAALGDEVDALSYEIPVDLSKIGGNDGKNAFQSGYQYRITVKYSNVGASTGSCDIVPWYDDDPTSSDATMQ